MPARSRASPPTDQAPACVPRAGGPGAGAIGGGTIVLLRVHAKRPYGLRLGVAGDADESAGLEKVVARPGARATARTRVRVRVRPRMERGRGLGALVVAVAAARATSDGFPGHG